MKQEPVGWMSEYGQFIGKVKDEICHIPLYTAPRKLSDEEILKEAENYGMDEKFIQDAPLFHAVKFAKAILKKASEK